MTNVVNTLRRIDWILFLSILTLAGLGLLAIWSVDVARDPGQLWNFKKQLIFVSVGVFLSLAMTLINYHALRSVSRLLYLLGGALLIGVLVFGSTIRGTKGWFTLGPITVQPVEFAKILLVIVLAKYISQRAHVVDAKVIFGAGVLTGGYVALTLMQPDFGSAFVILIIAIGMLLLTNVPRRYVVGGMVAAVLVALLGWQFFLKDYQKDRVRSFLNPMSDPFGRGYNIRQSVIAVGSGGIFGRGLGQGSQSQLRFLPEAQTDFVFAVLSEQLGFFVVLLIGACYGTLAFRLWVLMRTTSDGFAAFCVVGFFIIVGVQAVFNIGMNIGLLPVVGLPLPFVSLGGSAILSNFLLHGVVQSIRVRG